MKNRCLLFLAGLLAFNTSAHAVVVNGESTMCRESHGPSAKFNAFCLAMSTTFALPTLIVDAQEMDLNSDLASQRLIAETNGDADPVLLDKLAELTSHPADELVQAANKLSTEGKEVTVQAVLDVLVNVKSR